ncbi:hypothetical protein L3Q65_00090 (plasmid) [Amycolatopsis sp. FU40]|uniref:hypothetical protein n=1 Tax=Amycolatopsis sp. FU40 TaxID=2914159 RepID=UPI001F3CFC70|nr:hypothetical protein [Amycolatopsis sp. FU40]UKD50759.1 hypothetical protein L3Q65_00090 [Amycolatopsis sp. FU40]
MLGNDPYTTPVDLPELPAGARWGRAPSHHGTTRATSYVYPGRHVLVLDGETWPHQPETCPDDTGSGEWRLDGLVLVCTGCGLDCT